ncbi:MAG: hypothetical protein Q7Q73_08610 [Verrucomicrobiota bacterium JB024]|nr:hypothetical protein [Verrucomicrobiota bacterium JB024]
MKQFTLLASLSLLHAAFWAGQAPGAAQPVEADLGLIWSGLPLNQDMKLHCSFDKDNGGVADTAQGFPRPGGFGMQDVPDGIEGGAIQVAEVDLPSGLHLFSSCCFFAS